MGIQMLENGITSDYGGTGGIVFLSLLGVIDILAPVVQGLGGAIQRINTTKTY